MFPSASRALSPAVLQGVMRVSVWKELSTACLLPGLAMWLQLWHLLSLTAQGRALGRGPQVSLEPLECVWQRAQQ